MRAITLTTEQQTQAATNKAAMTNALTAYQTAMQTHLEYLRTATGLSANARCQLSSDGKTVICL